MKVRSYLYGLLIAFVMLMTGASYADQYADGVELDQPASSSFVLATWPPLVPANKSDNVDVSHVAMAGGQTDEDKTETCMACASIDQRTYSLVSHYKVTDNRIPKTVLACGYASKIAKPMKVPIRV